MRKFTRLKNHHTEIISFTRRSFLLIGLVLLFACLLIGRLVYLQILQHSVYSTLSRQNLLTIIPIEANRGLIYDRNGILLAKNVPAFNLSITPARVKDISATIKELKKIIPITDEDVKLFHHRRLQFRPYDAVPLKLNLPENDVAQFYMNQYRFPGVSMEAKLLRVYPFGNLFSNVLGYVSRINAEELKVIDRVSYSASNYIGKTGIEKQYETELHGQVGNEEVETDSSGRIVRTLRRNPPDAGKNLYLSLDARLQILAQTAMGEESGAIVIVDPQNGEVLAMVSKPSYDPNLFVSGISQKNYQALLNDIQKPLYDRDIRGLFSPASTIKPYFALGGLNNALITPSTKIVDHGVFTLPHFSHVFHDWVKGGHGVVDVVRAITVSCDIFFYTLAGRAGIKKMDDTLSKFGYGQPTHIDLPKELPGVLPTPTWKRQAKGVAWYPGDTINMGIGQGFLLVTPLQQAQAVSIIANRGILHPLHLLLKSVDADNHVTLNHHLPRQVVTLNNPDYWDTVISGMEGVIKNPRGTASRFGKDAPYTAAGKTGTAQVRNMRAGESEHEDPRTPKLLRSNHWFVSFAPIDHPEIVVIVILEHARGHDRIARVLMDYYFKYIKEEYFPKGKQTVKPEVVVPEKKTETQATSAPVTTTTKKKVKKQGIKMQKTQSTFIKQRNGGYVPAQ